MKKNLLIIFALGILMNINAQKNESGSYYPLTKGLSKTLTWYNSKYREIVKDTIIVNGKTYTEVSQLFPPKKEINIFLRKSNDSIFFLNQKTKSDRIFFGISGKIGQKIGDGTIIKKNAKLRTPKGKLRELLVIEMNYSNGAKDTRYYKKGLGLVAVKNSKGLISYYVSD
ncbi:hypothetical protein [Tenacibaculum ovolyticum]|uniref:hypothetical protein n=1 Tax=Tenacibaculum ovolyticum TaxID=104270 RepID=UPI001F46889A|nr:hypothetical protein [Tenacibaculum ovolyticum]